MLVYNVIAVLVTILMFGVIMLVHNEHTWILGHFAFVFYFCYETVPSTLNEVYL